MMFMYILVQNKHSKIELSSYTHG